MHLFTFSGEPGQESGMETSVRIIREKSYRLAEQKQSTRRMRASKKSATSMTTTTTNVSQQFLFCLLLDLDKLKVFKYFEVGKLLHPVVNKNDQSVTFIFIK